MFPPRSGTMAHPHPFSFAPPPLNIMLKNTVLWHWLVITDPQKSSIMALPHPLVLLSRPLILTFMLKKHFTTLIVDQMSCTTNVILHT